MNTPAEARPGSDTEFDKAAWTKAVAQYQRPSVGKSVGQLASTFIPYFVLWVLMVLSLDVTYWLTLLLAVPTALFMVRIFVLQHDCGHGSFFTSRRANDWVGFACSIFTYVPYHYWRRTHALHHAGAGDMDNRGVGDFYTMTVSEYAGKSRGGRFKYRLYRNPIVMFLIAPTFVFLVGYRFDYMKRTDWKRERKGLLWTNVALLMVTVGMSLLVGFWDYVLVQFPIVFIATAIGTWFFFVQHNYEDAYWASRPEWDYATAALHGSSYYKLPKLLQWFSGNIGFHHIHHLSPKIPNYLLAQCHEENPMFQSPVTLTLATGFKTTGLSLWDEENRKLISFRQFGRLQHAGPITAPATGGAD